MTMSLAAIRNCRYDNPTDSESDDNDGEYVTDGRQILRTERFHEISLFGRRKGPQHEVLTVIKPSNLPFDRLMNYRYYRLMDKSHGGLAEKSKK